MHKPIVTIIIPVYNLKDYVEKAYDSICSQTLTNWEMYLVDDGSTDGTAEVCDILASDDARIHVIHQENQGPAAARNAAIEKANGKYLYFLDADDWASPDMLYDMVCLAEHYYLDAWAGVPVDNAGRSLSSIGQGLQSPETLIADVPEEQCAQMVITGFYIETYYTESDYYLQKQSAPSRVFGDQAEFRDYAHVLFDRNLLYTPWNKLYLTSYIQENHFTFPSTRWDDFPFNLDVIRKIERVTVTDKAYYHFLRKRSDSESEKYNIGLYQKREEENEWLIGLYSGWKDELQQKFLETMEQEQIPVFTEDGESKEQDLTEPAAQPDEKESAATSDETETAEQPEAEEQSAEETAEKIGEEQETALAAAVPSVNFPSAEAEEFIARRYLERIVGCVENLTNPECSLTETEKRSEINEMINKESVREALKKAKPGSMYMKLMLLPIRLRSVNLTLMEGAVISKVKKKNIKLFAKLKANR